MSGNSPFSSLSGLVRISGVPSSPWAPGLRLVRRPFPSALCYAFATFSPLPFPFALVWDTDGVLRSFGFSMDRVLAEADIAFPSVPKREEKRQGKEKLEQILSLWTFPFSRGGEFLLAPQGTEFQRKVWSCLLRIPKGCVISYGDVARLIGRPGAGRAVGQAVGRNPLPLLIPCHRVIQSNGNLSNFGWGDAVKARLLGGEV